MVGAIVITTIGILAVSSIVAIQTAVLLYRSTECLSEELIDTHQMFVDIADYAEKCEDKLDQIEEDLDQAEGVIGSMVRDMSKKAPPLPAIPVRAEMEYSPSQRVQALSVSFETPHYRLAFRDDSFKMHHLYRKEDWEYFIRLTSAKAGEAYAKEIARQMFSEMDASGGEEG